MKPEKKKKPLLTKAPRARDPRVPAGMVCTLPPSVSTSLLTPSLPDTRWARRPAWPTHCQPARWAAAPQPAQPELAHQAAFALLCGQGGTPARAPVPLGLSVGTAALGV